MLESAECDNIPKQFKQFQVDKAEVSFAKFNFVNRGISMFIYIYIYIYIYKFDVIIKFCREEDVEW